jgi:eukaryotic-like serine/threonine-protein kinase
MPERVAPLGSRLAATDPLRPALAGDPIDKSDAEIEVLLRGDELIPRYRIRAAIGHGGMARILRAHDAHLDREVAIKCADASSATALAALRREQQTLAALNHGNIIAVLDAGVADAGLVWHSLPLIDGPSIASDMPRLQALPARQLCNVLLPIAEALVHAHAKGRLHNDVSPNNILLGRESGVVLLDWGSATRLGDGVRPDRVTSSYTAPEVLQGGAPCETSDLYALAAVISHVLTGRRALPDQRLSWRQAPATLRAVLQKALRGDPAQRYTSMAAFAGDLRAVVVDEPVSARPEHSWQKAWRRVRKHPGTSVAIAMTMASLFLVAGLVWRQWQK